MITPYDVHRVARLLEIHGIPVMAASEWNDVEDGEIQITKILRVQVGEDYLHVVHVEGNKITIDRTNYRPGRLVNRLKQLLR